MTIEKLENRITKILDTIPWLKNNGGDFFYEIATDYQDEEAMESWLSKIFESEFPREKFEEILDDWSFDYSSDYGFDNLSSYIKSKFTQEEEDCFDENEDEVEQFVRDSVCFYYNPEDFNIDVNVNIMIDCGNGNYDYTCDNILNWYGSNGDGTIDNESSMLWLAKTQGKATKLRKACKKVHRRDGYYINREVQSDKFVESCIQELENAPSSMETVTFLVKIPLLTLFKMIELQENEYDENGKYDPRLNKKSKSYIILGKETMCGLYDAWSGSGSVLEIELDKDVKVPLKYCVFCVDGCKMHGQYDVDEVYGLTGDCWKETLKEVKEIKAA